MNAKLQELLNVSLEGLISFVEGSAKFVAKEAPLLVLETVRFGVVAYGIGFFLSVITLAAGIAGMVIMGMFVRSIPLILGAELLAIIAFPVMMSCGRWYFLALLAPRLFIIRYLRSVMKDG